MNLDLRGSQRWHRVVGQSVNISSPSASQPFHNYTPKTPGLQPASQTITNIGPVTDWMVEEVEIMLMDLNWEAERLGRVHDGEFMILGEQ